MHLFARNTAGGDRAFLTQRQRPAGGFSMKSFWLCFVPLFVAVDALGVLPMFIGLTEGLDDGQRRRAVRQSVVTAAGVALAFLAIGTGLFRLLGITVADFMIAGGILLFVISLSDLLRLEKVHRKADPEGLAQVSQLGL